MPNGPGGAEPSPPPGATPGSMADASSRSENTPNLPKIAEKADDLEAIKKAVDDAAAVGGGLWLSYLFVLFYLAVAAGAVTHADLFFEKAVKLPFLNVELPLLAFFFLAPILFLVVHAYTLVHLVMLTDKAKRFHQALHDQIGDDYGLPWMERAHRAAIRDGLQRQLPSNIFVQFLAGPRTVRATAFGVALRAIAWITLVIAPVLLLLMMQIQFLPFHSGFITWTQRVALFVDLVLLAWLWRKVLSGHELGGPFRASWAWPVLGFVLSVAVLLFSMTVVTYPGEWQEERLASWRILPAMDEWGRPATEKDARGEPRTASFRDWVMNARKMSLHDWLFNAKPDEITRRRLPFSSTLVLVGLNVYEGLGIDDPEKAKWHDFVFRARGRDLRGAIFDFATLPKVDFEGADLHGASLHDAQLQGASLHDAQLQGASLNFAQLQGASLNFAQLQGASLGAAQLQGASLNVAQLQGASLGFAQLQGASLNVAQLQGASLADAQLQGASFDDAVLEATDFSRAYLWRSNRPRPPSEVASIRISGESWLPEWIDVNANHQTWDDKTYQTLRTLIGSVRPSDLALERIQSLDCSNSDTTLASCNSSAEPPPEAAAWRKALEDARVDDAAYAKALAAALKTLVCSGDDGAVYVVWGGGFESRLESGGPEAPALVDFIMSKDCPVSGSLTDADKAKLLRIKQDAIVATQKSVPGGPAHSP